MIMKDPLTVKDILNKRIAICMVFFLGLSILPLSNADAGQNAIGVNLYPIRYWSSELVFNDVFKRASHWGSIEGISMRPNKKHLDLDKSGWVKSLSHGQWVQTYLFADFRGHLPKGMFRCLYQGNGEIQFKNAVVKDEGHGWVNISFNQNANFVSVVIARTEPGNYIRNIRIVPLDEKGNPVTETYRKDFLDRWKKFKAVRFMDWMATNYNHQTDWSDRSTQEFFSQATKERGVALEYMIEFSNTLKLSPWFCLPHAANDEYIRNFAMMVRDRLDPGLKVYIEYSNEVWNSLFPAQKYAERMGIKLGLAKNNNLATTRFYSHRSLEIFEIWKRVFGGTERLVRVLASQSHMPARGREILRWENAYKKADAFAIAPYFSARSLLRFPGNAEPPSFNELIRLIKDDIDKKKQIFSEYIDLSREMNIQLVAYEGGQHLVSQENLALRKLYLQLNRSPEMYHFYMEYLNAWFHYGGGLFMHFSSVSRPSRFGYWGSLEWYDQKIKAKSKYSALLEVLGGIGSNFLK